MVPPTSFFNDGNDEIKCCIVADKEASGMVSVIGLDSNKVKELCEKAKEEVKLITKAKDFIYTAVYVFNIIYTSSVCTRIA